MTDARRSTGKLPVQADGVSRAGCISVSKWYLAAGALDSGLKVFSIAGPVVLLISALLLCINGRRCWG